MYKVYFIDTFNDSTVDLQELAEMSNEDFKEKAQSEEFSASDFEKAFDTALDQAYVHGKSILENTVTGLDYIMDDDSDEVQIMKLARNHEKVPFKDVIEGVKADSKKFAKAYLQ